MRILIVHNEYQQRGGEDVVVESEFSLLSEKHEVEKLIVSNRVINTLVKKLKVALNTHYSKDSYKNLKRKLNEFRPQVVHVHNFFPLLTPSIFMACKDLKIPAVLTLHNYRLVDPSGLLLNNGVIDERSLSGSAYDLVFDRVYRNSWIHTAIVAHMIEYHRKKKTWNTHVDIFIALTNFAKSKFVEGGLSDKKIVVKPNSIPDPGFSQRDLHMKTKGDFVFIGRLSPEKGILTLIQSWKEISEQRLVIVGDGPCRGEVEEFCAQKENVVYMGFLDREEISELLKGAKSLIFPSEWYEGFPMVILEAFAAGTPVISSDIGSQKEIVKHEINGVHFRAGSPLSLKNTVYEMIADNQSFAKLCLGARESFVKDYYPISNLDKLESIYKSLIQ